MPHARLAVRHVRRRQRRRRRVGGPARKAAREQAAAKALAAREQGEAVQRVGQTTWRFVAAGDEDEDSFSLHIRGKKPESLGFLAATIDCTPWEPLNDYLRREQNFDVANVKDKLMLSVKLEVDGEARYQQRVRDATELGTHFGRPAWTWVR